MPGVYAAISLTFAHPWWWLAAVAAVAPVWIARAGRRRGRATRPWVTAARCVAVALVVAALARPMLRGVGASARPWLVLRDVSASTRRQGASRPMLPEGIGSETLSFAGGLAEPGRPVDVAATNLAPALRLAAARAAAGRIGGVVIQTDGQFTDTDWPAAAELLRQRDVPVLIVPLTRPPADARIVDLSVRRSERGAIVHVTVSANAPQQRTLTVRRAGDGAKELLRRTLQLLPGDPATFELADRPPAGAVSVYSASLDPADAFAENDRAETVIAPQRRRLAMVAAPGAALAIDRPRGVDVRRVAPADAATTVDGWMQYAGVVVVDPTGKLLTPAQRRSLADYVRSGGGLLLIGTGRRDTPGELDDPLNRVAALVANPFQRRPLAVTVVLDASGSMAQRAGATARFDQAAQAVTALEKHLTDVDTLTVIVFSDQPRTVYDSGDGPADFAELADALQQVAPAGPTHVWPALQLAARPGGAQRQRLILAVSDLETEPFAVATAAQRLVEVGASLAVVAVTDGSGRTDRYSLAALSRTVDAPLVATDDLVGLAEVFGTFIRQHRGPGVRRGRFRVAIDDSSAGGAPAELSAYVLCAPTADNVEVLGRIESDPVLAIRRVGLGRSASVAAVVGSDGIDGRAAGQLAGRVMAWMVGPPGDPRISGQIARRGGEVVVQLDAFEAHSPVNGLSLTASLAGADRDGPLHRAPLQQIAPGRYEVVLPAGDGAGWVSVADESGGVLWRSAVSRTGGREFDAIGVNWAALGRLERLVGGRIVADTSAATISRAAPRAGGAAVWPWLLGAAMALVLASWVAGRRGGVGRRGAI